MFIYHDITQIIINNALISDILKKVYIYMSYAKYKIYENTN